MPRTPATWRGGEAQVLAGAQTGVVEHLRDLHVAVGGAVLAHDRQGVRWGAAGSAPFNDEFVGGAGVPAHADAHGVGVLSQQQGHVGDQRAQQPLAVARACRRRVPEPGQIRRQRRRRLVISRSSVEDR